MAGREGCGQDTLTQEPPGSWPDVAPRWAAWKRCLPLVQVPTSHSGCPAPSGEGSGPCFLSDHPQRVLEAPLLSRPRGAREMVHLLRPGAGSCHFPTPGYLSMVAWRHCLWAGSLLEVPRDRELVPGLSQLQAGWSPNVSWRCPWLPRSGLCLLPLLSSSLCLLSLLLSFMDSRCSERSTDTELPPTGSLPKHSQQLGLGQVEPWSWGHIPASHMDGGDPSASAAT